MKLDLKAWIDKVTTSLQDLLTRKYLTFNGSSGLKMEMVNRSVTSNSSGLINISDLGVDMNNASGIQVACTTSNYRVSNPILWSNNNYYVTLFGWNNATAVANKQVSIILTWFHS